MFCFCIFSIKVLPLTPVGGKLLNISIWCSWTWIDFCANNFFFFKCVSVYLWRYSLKISSYKIKYVCGPILAPPLTDKQHVSLDKSFWASVYCLKQRVIPFPPLQSCYEELTTTKCKKPGFFKCSINNNYDNSFTLLVKFKLYLKPIFIGNSASCPGIIQGYQSLFLCN